MNELMAESWSDTEVNSEIVKRCKYWFDKAWRGENWFGIGRSVKVEHSLVDDLMMRDPDAFQHPASSSASFSTSSGKTR
jgi:hypothetical protein